MKLVALLILNLFSNNVHVYGDCSDGMLSTLMEEILSMKATISALESTNAVLEYRMNELEELVSEESCSCTVSQETGMSPLT